MTKLTNPQRKLLSMMVAFERISNEQNDEQTYVTINTVNCAYGLRQKRAAYELREKGLIQWKGTKRDFEYDLLLTDKGREAA
jgi:hypothetical protein